MSDDQLLKDFSLGISWLFRGPYTEIVNTTAATTNNNRALL